MNVSTEAFALGSVAGNSKWDAFFSPPLVLIADVVRENTGSSAETAQLIAETVMWCIVFPVFTVILAYWPGLLFFDYVDKTHKPEFIYKRKIQPNKLASAKLLSQQSLYGETIGSLYSIFVVSSLKYNAPFFVFMRWTFGFQLIGGEVPTMLELAKNVVLGLLLLDVFYFFNHWAWHTNPTLYKYVHKFHHEYMVSNIYTHNYFNAPESYLTFFFCYFPPAILLNMHPMTYLLMITTFQLVDNFWHAGYYLPWLPMNWFPSIWSDQTFHDYHHRRPDQGAYGLFIRPLDTLFGTDRGYAKWRATWSKYPGEHAS
ncbi:hypothetical protein M427DRAFT_271352 [Gonapodya prolifera JEL478]|uniref:Fatty acid hydroxylase domain-containing protein n=1 Tax=Gonapodya prolifera (strain JEL478) TaxID=1344416 RepID=A0A139AXK8_GONPJ|nr:hypothetical protein M427DRAFT_271352 [Gonapodya prolifera JEL478]|eukprot:KXS21482.1 hypothetical protein M427DRAFT_271352 [Gonapodya prolifera JEL478]